MRLDGVSPFSIGAQCHRLLKVIIESGGMYCVTWLILLCLVLTNSIFSHIFLSIVAQLTVRHLIDILTIHEIADPRILLKKIRPGVGNIPNTHHRARNAESDTGLHSETRD